MEPSSDPDAQVCISLHLTSVEQPCAYLALSYAWGLIERNGSHLSETFICDAFELKVTASLYSRLKSLRERWMNGTLLNGAQRLTVCADQICIEQRNHVERSQQVMLVQRIYSLSQGLVIWLGEIPSNISSVAIGHLKAVELADVSGGEPGYCPSTLIRPSQARGRLSFKSRFKRPLKSSYRGVGFAVVGLFKKSSLVGATICRFSLALA